MPPDGLPPSLGRYQYLGPAELDGQHFEVYGDGEQEVGITWWDAALGGAPRDGAPVTGARSSTMATAGWSSTAKRLWPPSSGATACTRWSVPTGEDVAALAAALPEDQLGSSIADRLRSAGRSLLEAFGVGD